MTESLTRDGREQELARQARELIINELRHHHRMPADAALARALDTANAFIYEEGRFHGGFGQQFLHRNNLGHGFTRPGSHCRRSFRYFHVVHLAHLDFARNGGIDESGLVLAELLYLVFSY